MSSIKISVIIGSLNQLSILKKVLPFYEKQYCKKELFEVIVIDSSSIDGSVKFLQEYRPNYHFVMKVQENRGKTVARNNGVAMAKGNYLIITDADMIPDPQFIQAHLNAHEMQKEPCSFEGLAWNVTSLEWPPNKDKCTPQVDRNPSHMTKLGWYYYLTGNISLRKETFHEHQGFNELFQGYGWEDLELGYRLEKAQVPLYYLKTAINYHFHVITKEEEIERNIQKGASAQMMLKLHPELKWFLGLNPISTFIFSKIKKDSYVYQWIKRTCFSSKNKMMHAIGFWFLKEYNYLKGALRS